MSKLSHTPDDPENSLECYLGEISQYRLLTAAEERELGLRIQAGDASARSLMINANLRLVVHIAREYQSHGLPLNDLIEEGNLGLMRAVEGYDPNLGYRFSTYADPWIRQSIRRGLVNTGKTIRVPAYMAQLLTRYRRAHAELREALGREPSLPEIGERLGLSERQLTPLKDALALQSATLHAEQIDPDWSLSDLVSDNRSAPPDARLERSDAINKIRDNLEHLDPREREVIELRFGLLDHEPRTLTEIGRRLNLTRERVRQIEAHALGKLRQGL